MSTYGCSTAPTEVALQSGIAPCQAVACEAGGRIVSSSSARKSAFASLALAAMVLGGSAAAREARPLVDVAIIESGTANIASEVLIAEKGASPAHKIAAARSVATVVLRNGATLEFIDAGDGHVDVAERTAQLLPFVSQEMLLRWNATPLEIFRTLNPGALSPQVLVADHYRRTAGNANGEPRALAMPTSATFALDDPGLEPYVCDSLGLADWWIDDWNDAFAGITSYSAATYLHHFSAYTFYPGAAVYYGTGTNRKTYLGACNGTEGTIVTMSVDRWVVTNVTFNPFPQPPTVTWGWGTVDEVDLSNGEKYTYYSGHPTGRYRGRVEGPGGMAVSHMGVAAAWTPSFPLGFGSP
jgi:hypothetical protein